VRKNEQRSEKGKFDTAVVLNEKITTLQTEIDLCHDRIEWYTMIHDQYGKKRMIITG
jgi:hypothetical protein